MKTNVAYMALALTLLSCAAAPAADGKGGQPGVFRELKLGGRPAAMGGAYVAVAEGGIGHLYNPAGPALSRQYIAAFSYRAMHLDRRLGFASASIPAREEAVISVAWVYAGTAPLEGRDIQGNILPDNPISHSENLIAVNFAKRFIPQLSIGGKAFYLQNNIGNINATTAGVDFGVLTMLDLSKTAMGKMIPVFQAGLAVENLGANYKWTTTDYWQTLGQELGSSFDEKLPVIFRLGMAVSRPGRFLVAADLAASTASVLKTHFGGEYVAYRDLCLRAGLDDWHPTLGAGLMKKFDKLAIVFDFAYLLDKVGEGNDLLASFELRF